MNKYVFLILMVSPMCSHAMEESQGKDAIANSDANRAVIEKAIHFALDTTDSKDSEIVTQICRHIFQKVEECNYVGAIELTLDGLMKYPRNFSLQMDLAYLLSDCAEVNPPQFISQEIKDKMMQRSDEIFNKLMKEVEAQPKAEVYRFKNEFYYHFRMHREQYELGLHRVSEYWGTSEWDTNGYRGYYSQGVGAARYAQQLVQKGDKILALDYAQKAIVAWAQYFSYKNDYYNAYVHYALALGILGYKDEMMLALHRSALIIKKDLNYFEFKNVIDFVTKFCV